MRLVIVAAVLEVLVPLREVDSHFVKIHQEIDSDEVI